MGKSCQQDVAPNDIAVCTYIDKEIYNSIIVSTVKKKWHDSKI